MCEEKAVEEEESVVPPLENSLYNLAEGSSSSSDDEVLLVHAVKVAPSLRRLPLRLKKRQVTTETATPWRSSKLPQARRDSQERRASVFAFLANKSLQEATMCDEHLELTPEASINNGNTNNRAIVDDMTNSNTAGAQLSNSIADGTGSVMRDVYDSLRQRNAMLRLAVPAFCIIATIMVLREG